MSKNIIRLLLMVVALTLIFAGCGRNPLSGNDSSFLSVDSLMPDTLLVDDKDSIPEELNLTLTEDILKYMDESADRDRYEIGILPQMARDVPEYAGKLLDNKEAGFLIVDKNTLKCYRYDRFGVEQERVGITCARPYGSKHKRGDNRTPEGYFTIEGIYDSTDWLFTDDDGKTSDVKGQFGPRFMRLRTPVSSQIGIHGTAAPWSIGGRRSHGCIRMTNENILRFVEICQPGWPVIVSPGPRDMQVNEEEGYNIPSVAVIAGRPRCKPRSTAMTDEETSGKVTSGEESMESSDSIFAVNKGIERDERIEHGSNTANDSTGNSR